MTEEERRLEARKRLAKARQKSALDAENIDPMVPRADSEDFAPEETESKPTNFRSTMSEVGLELAEQAQKGLNPYKSDGVTKLPTEMPLGYGDIQVKFPKAFRDAVEFVGDAAATAGGYGMAGYGYVVGGVADILTKAGVNESTARRFARDMMALPDAFVGSPSSLMRPRGGKPPTVGGVSEAGVARKFTPEELAAAQNVQFQPIPNAAPPSVSSLTPEKLGELIRVASSGGRGSQAAAEAIAQAARINPEAAAAARRLGIDVPADVLSDDTQLKSAAGLSRSLAGSEAEATFRDTVVLASQRADEIMRELDAGPDISCRACEI